MEDNNGYEEYAIKFKQYHSCVGCPFVKNDADVGIGVINDCDYVCLMEVPDIIKRIEEYEKGGG